MKVFCKTVPQSVVGFYIVENTECCTLDWKKCKRGAASPGTAVWIPGEGQCKRTGVASPAIACERRMRGGDRA